MSKLEGHEGGPSHKQRPNIVFISDVPGSLSPRDFIGYGTTI